MLRPEPMPFNLLVVFGHQCILFKSGHKSCGRPDSAVQRSKEAKEASPLDFPMDLWSKDPFPPSPLLSCQFSILKNSEV